jgi:hypothetical protein
MPSLRFALRSGTVKQASILVTIMRYMDTDTAHSFQTEKVCSFNLFRKFLT